MKKIIRTLLILLVTVHAASATIHRINNADASADYSSIQTAIDDDANVFDGDTLMIEGSAVYYGSAVLDKRLVVIGPGYFLTENSQTSNSSSLANVLSFTFNPGSEGSLIAGLRFDENYSNNEPYIYVDNITILRCYLGDGVTVHTNKNLTIMNCIFPTSAGFSDGSNIRAVSIRLIGNIIKAHMNFINNDEYSFAEISNNIFLDDCQFDVSIFRNNIWKPILSSTFSVAAGLAEHNLIFNGFLGTENGNMSFSSNDVVELLAESSTDGQWRLDPSSPFKGTGSDGTDPGPFGGSNPYVLSGVPPIPVIYEISTTGFGNQETGLPVTIKIRSN